jgi:hypothetical protein
VRIKSEALIMQHTLSERTTSHWSPVAPVRMNQIALLCMIGTKGSVSNLVQCCHSVGHTWVWFVPTHHTYDHNKLYKKIDFPLQTTIVCFHTIPSTQRTAVQQNHGGSCGMSPLLHMECLIHASHSECVSMGMGPPMSLRVSHPPHSSFMPSPDAKPLWITRVLWV